MFHRRLISGNKARTIRITSRSLHRRMNIQVRLLRVDRTLSRLVQLGRFDSITVR